MYWINSYTFSLQTIFISFSSAASSTAAAKSSPYLKYWTLSERATI
jgi:hypothetical protein